MPPAEKRATVHKEIRFMNSRRFVLFLAGFTLWVAPVMVSPIVESAGSALAAEWGDGELIGKVVNTSNKVLKRRVQVQAGGREWTLHVPDRTPVTHAKEKISVHDLDVGTYVRAIGERIGNTRLRADRVYVIGDRLAFLKSGYARRAGEAGYFTGYAGYRGTVRR
jgi:hypothetical protein